jgi:serine protease AprX
MISMRIARAIVGALITLATLPVSVSAQSPTSPGKLDSVLQKRVGVPGQTRVIVCATDARSLGSLNAAILQHSGKPGRILKIVNCQAATVANTALTGLANHAAVRRIAEDRKAVATMERTGATIYANTVRSQMGYDGTGIGIAVIDSGVTSWHDDLAYPAGGAQRIDRFVDFVGGRAMPYDDYGHGTHVAGIIAGNGFDSGGARSGIAPGAHLTVLKALNGSGNGYISDVIAALDYVLTTRAELNTRVVNLSIATGVYESYNTDLLTLAALKLVKAGIVVSAASGNYGRSSSGKMMYGGITSPGNAPWVLTVGASSHMGTIDRADDTIAAFSSRGPTALDNAAKPDVVAPGVGIESLSDPSSAFYTSKAAYLLKGTVKLTYLPYLSLSGTSMATPVVSGTVALMLQANPSLTPNAVKAILQYTAQYYPGYDPLTEGAGFLNAKGAVELAHFLANPGSAYPTSTAWSHRIIWGNRQYEGGRITPEANAWLLTTPWGSPSTPAGQEVAWGQICSVGDCAAGTGTWTPWGTSDVSRNVVWGNNCAGADCTGTWTIAAANGGDTVVWGTTNGDTVVWGTNDGDTVVWGTSDGDTVVWGTACTDSSCHVLWKRQ